MNIRSLALFLKKAAVLAGLLVCFSPANSSAGVITTTNTSSQSLASSTPILDGSGVPMQPGVGFIAVGTFRTMLDSDLRFLSAGKRSFVNSDFVRYGSSLDFGHLGFEGLYSETATRSTALPSGTSGRGLYTVIGNSNSILNSTELLIYRHTDQPALTDDPYSANADLSDQAGELILGNFGTQADVSDGSGFTLPGLDSYRLERLVGDIVPLPANCAVEPSGENLNITSQGGDAILPHLAGSVSGKSVLTWTTTGLLGFKCRFSTFDANGAIQVDSAEVHAGTAGQFGSVVAMREDGSFVIAWLALDGGGPDFHAFARRFAADGTPEGNAFRVSGESFPEFVGYQTVSESDARSKLSVAIHEATGNFAIGWGGPDKLFLRLFTAAGAPKTVPLLLDAEPGTNLGGDRFGMGPVAIDGAGNVLVAYRELNEILVAKFNSTGTQSGSPIIITENSRNDRDPQLSVEADGGFLVGWFEDYPGRHGDLFLRQWYGADMRRLTSLIRIRVDSQNFGSARIATGPASRPHYTVSINDAGNDWHLDVFSNGGKQQLLPDTAFLGRDGAINENTWRSAAAGKHMVMAYEEQLINSKRIVFRRFQVSTAGENAFAVNQTTMEDQSNQEIASNGAGLCVVVWRERLGSDIERIMGRLFDSEGVPLTDEFVVGPTRGQFQFDPRVSMAPDGKFVVVWEAGDADADRDGILGRRFDATGQPMGDVFLVNGGLQTDDQNDPDVAISPDGSFVAVWESRDQPDPRAVFQRFDTGGKVVGPVVQTASAIPAGADDENPRIDMDSQGRFAISWMRDGVDPGNGGNLVEEPYLRCFAADGTPLFDELRVGTQGNHGDAHVAVNDSNGWAVVWETVIQKGDPTWALVASRGTMTSNVRTHTQDLVTLQSYSDHDVTLGNDGTLEVIFEGSSQIVLAARYDASHALIGPDYEVVPEGDQPRFADLGNGRRFAVWEVSLGSDFEDEIFGRVFTYSENYAQFQEGSEQRVNRVTTGRQDEPRVAMNEDGVGVVVWAGEVGADDQGVVARYITEDGFLSPSVEFSVETSTTRDSGLPDVVWLGTNQCVVAWSEEGSDGAVNLYYRKMMLDGGLLIRLPLETGLVNLDVRVAGREDGTFAAVWSQQPSILGSQSEIHAKVIGGDGTTIADLTAGISASNRPGRNPSVAMAGNHVLFIWQEDNPQPAEEDILAGKLYEIEGTNLNLVKSLAFDTFIGEEPSVAMREDGHSVITWEGVDATGDQRLFARCFDTELNPVGGLIEIDPEADTPNGAGDVEVVMDSEGNFSIAWSANPSETFAENDVFLRRFDRYGVSIDEEYLRVNESQADDQFNPDIAMDSRGNTLIVWENYDTTNSGPDIWARRLTTFRTTTGFDNWAEAFGDPEVLDPEGDPDCDDLTNLMEYIMNLDPLVPDPAGGPEFAYDAVAQGVQVAVRWRQRNDDASIVAKLEESSDLQTWTEPVTAVGSEVIDSLTDLMVEGVVIPDTSARKYYRIRFSLDAGN